MAINEWSTTPASNASGVTGVNWAEGQAPSTVNDSARAIMADVAAWYGQAKTPEYLTGVAGTNTVTATGPASMAAYAAGQRFTLIPAATNTGATTVNITPSGGAALGAKNLFAGGAACVGGEVRISVPIEVIYDGTQFNLIGPYVGGSLPTGQVKFPGTQNASSDVNTLDDYEEGTWTPGVGGSATYTTQAGTYTKIGRLVHIRGTMTINAIGTGSTSTISGLPFTSIETSSIPVHAWGGLAIAEGFVVGATGTSTTTIVFTGADAGGTSLPGSAAIFTGGAAIAFSGCYHTS